MKTLKIILISIFFTTLFASCSVEDDMKDVDIEKTTVEIEFLTGAGATGYIYPDGNTELIIIDSTGCFDEEPIIRYSYNTDNKTNLGLFIFYQIETFYSNNIDTLWYINEVNIKNNAGIETIYLQNYFKQPNIEKIRIIFSVEDWNGEILYQLPYETYCDIYYTHIN